ncbi:MAG: MFS transporter [Hyphomicrobiaceae bacterium]
MHLRPGPDEPSTPTAAADPGSNYGRPAYRWYVLGVMTLILTAHALDRSLPQILVEPVKQEFRLSDGEVGLFAGLVYGIAFSVAALPMGWLADRVSSRRNMLTVVVTVWSLLTALGGLAHNFFQLLLSRFGMGASEGGTAAAAMPIVTDIFPAGRRGFALGIYYIGHPAGTFLATAVGGYIAHEYGWRTAFLLAGVPGLIGAALLYFTVREPERGGAEAAEVRQEKGASMKESLKFLARHRALPWVIAGHTTFGLLSLTLGAWTSSFFIRVHHLGLAEAGAVIGTAALVCSLISPAFVGWLADKLGAQNPRWPLRLLSLCALGSLAFTGVQLYAPSVSLSIAAFAAAELMRWGFAAPSYATLLDNTPARMRGAAVSVVQLTTTFMGLAVGPMLAGFLSDVLGGGASIRHALAAVSLLYLAAAAFYLIANRALYGRGRANAAAGFQSVGLQAAKVGPDPGEQKSGE